MRAMGWTREQYMAHSEAERALIDIVLDLEVDDLKQDDIRDYHEAAIAARGE